jgi:hypothetical protein
VVGEVVGADVGGAHLVEVVQSLLRAPHPLTRVQLAHM